MAMNLFFTRSVLPPPSTISVPRGGPLDRCAHNAPSASKKKTIDRRAHMGAIISYSARQGATLQWLLPSKPVPVPQAGRDRSRSLCKPACRSQLGALPVQLAMQSPFQVVREGLSNVLICFCFHLPLELIVSRNTRGSRELGAAKNRIRGALSNKSVSASILLQVLPSIAGLSTKYSVNQRPE